MTLRNDIIRNGNGKAIMRMRDAGMGPRAIQGTFADHGIRVPLITVQGIIAGHEVLGQRAIPRAAVNAAVAAHQQVAGVPAAQLAG